MFSEGFFGTKAPFYMDLATLFFIVLPFLLFFSIRFAIKKEYKKHFISQSIILALTLIIVVIFEIGVRLSGGFMEYSKSSFVEFEYLLTFLIVHIFIAIITISLWIYLYIISVKKYKKNTLGEFSSKHKKLGKISFFLISLTSLMGSMMYIFLFVKF